MRWLSRLFRWFLGWPLIAIVSLLTGRTVKSDVAMTGEISLRGLVLPIGGVKNKVLAAMRAGITTVGQLLAQRAQRGGARDEPRAENEHPGLAILGPLMSGAWSLQVGFLHGRKIA